MTKLGDLAVHFSYVRSCLLRFGARRPDVDDLSQEVFHRLLDRQASFDPERPMRPWLTGLAFRVWREFERSRRRHSAVSSSWASPPESPEVVLTKRELALSVKAATEKIAPGRRSIFELHEMEGLSVPEAARRENLPLNTAYSQLRLAREEFRRAITASELIDTSVAPATEE